MSINQTSGQVITLAEATTLTQNFRTRHPNEIKAFFVGADKVNLVLQQPGCIGIRIYNGYSESAQSANRVLVGVDAQGNDLVNGTIVEHLVPCPTYCSKTGSLTGP